MNLSVRIGTTLRSGKMLFVNEPLPTGITYTQILAGIAANTYTKKSLAGHTFKGQARERAGAKLGAELVITTANDELSFTIPAAVTKLWPNEITTLFYDIQDTTTSTGAVDCTVYGKIAVVPSITIEA